MLFAPSPEFHLDQNQTPAFAPAIFPVLQSVLAANDSPVVQSVSPEPYMQLGNTGILPVQAIESAAWIRRPAYSDAAAQPNTDFCRRLAAAGPAAFFAEA